MATAIIELKEDKLWTHSCDWGEVLRLLSTPHEWVKVVTTTPDNKRGFKLNRVFTILVAEASESAAAGLAIVHGIDQTSLVTVQRPADGDESLASFLAEPVPMPSAESEILITIRLDFMRGYAHVELGDNHPAAAMLFQRWALDPDSFVKYLNGHTKGQVALKNTPLDDPIEFPLDKVKFRAPDEWQSKTIALMGELDNDGNMAPACSVPIGAVDEDGDGFIIVIDGIIVKAYPVD